jgi:DNA mismatch repair ATPase MutS
LRICIPSATPELEGDKRENKPLNFITANVKGTFLRLSLLDPTSLIYSKLNIMLNKITLVSGLMTILALSQCTIAHADSVADEINSTNELSQQVESQAQQPQSTDSGNNEVTNEIKKANDIATEAETSVQPQSTDSGSNDDANEVKKANALAGETEKSLRDTPSVDSGSSSNSFVSGAVRESNRVASEVERNNASLMQKNRQTTDVAGSGVSNERTPSYDSTVSTQSSSSSGTSNNSSLIPIGMGIVAIGGVFCLVKLKTS